MILYQALYNPMIHESASYTLSIHKTRKGAEMAIEFHKNEIKKEELQLYDPNDVIGEYKWDDCKWWGINEIELLD
jgi:hypothetical protein